MVRKRKRTELPARLKQTAALLLAGALLTAVTACALPNSVSENPVTSPNMQETVVETRPPEQKTQVTPEPETGTSEYTDGQEIALDPQWTYAGETAIHSGCAVMYLATGERRNIIVGVNAGHGTEGGTEVKTWCHPDHSPKLTGEATSAGSVMTYAVTYGMIFRDGTPEHEVTLAMARILRDKLLAGGYDVLMIRDGEDVQLDNIARTVICNNIADCHIALHWDGDGLDYDKGVFFASVPDGLKSMPPVAETWEADEALGRCLIDGLAAQGVTRYENGSMDLDLTQTSYSTIPSVDVELGNQVSDHGQETLERLADGLLEGINTFFAEYTEEYSVQNAA